MHRSSFSRTSSRVALLAALASGGCATDAGLDPLEAMSDEAALTTCPSFGNRRALGDTQDARLTESSGLAASRKNPRIIWTHNDSGDTERLFALDTGTARMVGVINISSNANGDWEDIALGPGPVAGMDYLYVGRIGNASSYREIVRIEEPVADYRASTVASLPARGVTRFRFAYPGGAAYNSETLMLDSRTRDLYVVTKNFQGHSQVYRYAYPQDASVTKTLQLVASVDFNVASSQQNDRLTTAGDISPDGSEILIKTYNQTYLWRRGTGQTVAQALAGTRCAVTHAGGTEAIAFAADASGYYSMYEGSTPTLYFTPRQ